MEEPTPTVTGHRKKLSLIGNPNLETDDSHSSLRPLRQNGVKLRFCSIPNVAVQISSTEILHMVCPNLIKLVCTPNHPQLGIPPECTRCNNRSIHHILNKLENRIDRRTFHQLFINHCVHNSVSRTRGHPTKRLPRIGNHHSPPPTITTSTGEPPELLCPPYPL